jgi:glutamine synthetase type III
MNTTETVNRVEAIVDESCLINVIAALAEMCYAKASHLDSNWQDHTAAHVWEKAAIMIDRLNQKMVATIDYPGITQ